MDVGIGGAILFILYINDIQFNVPVTDKITLYADDCTLLFKRSDLIDLEIEANNMANEVVQFFNDSDLTINSNKSHVISFDYKYRPFHPTITLGETNIESCTVVNMLGLSMDSKLNWGDHVNKISLKLSRSLFAFRNIVKRVPKTTAKSVYYALIESHIAYGIELWGSTSKQNIQRIFVLQKSAIRYLEGLKFPQTCRESFSSLSILTVPSLYIFKSILHVKDRLNSFQVNSDIHGYNTRGRNNISVERHRLSVFEKTPTYRGQKFFAKLPADLRSIVEEKQFKTKLYSFLSEKAFYEVDEFLLE